MLAAVARGGFRDEIELLVCGRLALSDIAALAKLRAMGILERPKLLPGWLRNWQTLLPFFAFTSFLEGIGLKKVEGPFWRVDRRGGECASKDQRRSHVARRACRHRDDFPTRPLVRP